MKMNEENQQEEKKKIKKAAITIMGVSLAIFACIMFFTDTIGTYFGKTAENVVLVIIGCLLAFLLYKSNKSQ